MQRKRRSPKSLDLNEEMRTIVIGTFYVNNILVEKNIIRCMKWCQILHALYLLLLGLEGEKRVEQADYEVRMLAEYLLEGEVCLWVKITFCHDVPYIFCKDNANRVQKQQACLIVFAEMPPILSNSSHLLLHTNFIFYPHTLTLLVIY